jgi:hypothetical protein
VELDVPAVAFVEEVDDVALLLTVEEFVVSAAAVPVLANEMRVPIPPMATKEELDPAVVVPIVFEALVVELAAVVEVLLLLAEPVPA